MRRTRVEVGALELTAFHRLLPERLGLELSRGELIRVHTATRGNPFFALEVGRARLHAGAITPDQPLPVPANLGRLLGQRLALVDRHTSCAAHRCVRGDPRSALLTDVHGEPAVVESALAEGASEGVIEQVGGRVRFVHPLFASVVTQQAVPRQRAEHLVRSRRSSATLKSGRAISAGRRRARTLLLAALLAQAAEVAAAPGQPRRLLSCMSSLPPVTRTFPTRASGGSSPLAPVDWQVRWGSARESLELLLGAAVRWAQSAPTSSPSSRPPLAATGAATLAAGAPDRMIDLLDEALIEAGDDDERASRALARRVGMHIWRTDARSALTDGHAALERAERVDDPLGVAVAITVSGWPRTSWRTPPTVCWNGAWRSRCERAVPSSPSRALASSSAGSSCAGERWSARGNCRDARRRGGGPGRGRLARHDLVATRRARMVGGPMARSPTARE